jgi:hypothetical protein
MQVRVERPSRNFEAVVSFYRDVVGLPVLASFEEYLGSAERVTSEAARIRAAGFEPTVDPNPYWTRTGAVCFLDPDGYSLVLSPEAW